MPWFKNEKPSILGLSHKGDGGVARTVQPGEVFEAEADEIPQAWKDAGFISDAKAPPAKPKDSDLAKAMADNAAATADQNPSKGKAPEAQAVPDVASEEAPTDKEVHDADEAREKPGFFGGKKHK